MISEASEGAPFSQRTTEAEVSSQEVSIPSTSRAILLSTLVEQSRDQRPIHRRAPIVSPDHAFHDYALTIEQEALRNPRCLIDLLHLGAPILEQVEGETEVLAKGPDVLGRSLVDAHGGDFESMRSEGAIQPLHGGHFDPAGLTPGGPHVDQGYLSPVTASQTDRITGGEIHGVKVRRPGADRDLLHVRPVSGQDGSTDGQATHDQANQQPGTGHRAKPELYIAASARGPPERDRGFQTQRCLPRRYQRRRSTPLRLSRR